MKTGLCNYSGLKIHPGHGRKFVRIDCKSFTFERSKCETQFFQRRNPRKLRWTQIYRRIHKKGQNEEATQKKRTRRTTKLQRAIVGASLEVIKQKRNEKPKEREALRQKAVQEQKEKAKKRAEERKKNQATQPKQPSKASVPKNQPKGKGKNR
eukprot:TRINITY_DN80581_c0_g1_i1.p1 TRINITY_DN80581_c0_g1~~TRINITY_DN80581_c0_g1_i1.p1  ORF type:complete len:153 (+),score=29.88 TRINITY_DN80581_c0_g1_i1:70-528(+)